MRTQTSNILPLFGSSLTRYEFNVYPFGTTFNPLAGVYVFLKNGVYPTVLYVGQTQDFANRLTPTHHRWQSARLHGVTHTGVLLVSDERQRLAIEADLIAYYIPPCNQR